MHDNSGNFTCHHLEAKIREGPHKRNVKRRTTEKRRDRVSLCVLKLARGVQRPVKVSDIYKAHSCSHCSSQYNKLILVYLFSMATPTHP